MDTTVTSLNWQGVRFVSWLVSRYSCFSLPTGTADLHVTLCYNRILTSGFILECTHLRSLLSPTTKLHYISYRGLSFFSTIIIALNLTSENMYQFTCLEQRGSQISQHLWDLSMELVMSPSGVHHLEMARRYLEIVMNPCSRSLFL